MIEQKQSARLRISSAFFGTVAMLSLSACLAVERPAARELAEAGIPGSEASCMAIRWSDDLSEAQIHDVVTYAAELNDAGRDMSRRDISTIARSWDDPDAFEAVTDIVLRCGGYHRRYLPGETTVNAIHRRLSRPDFDY